MHFKHYLISALLGYMAFTTTDAAIEKTEKSIGCRKAPRTKHENRHEISL